MRGELPVVTGWLSRVLKNSSLPRLLTLEELDGSEDERMRNETDSANRTSAQDPAGSFIIVARDQHDLWQALTREFKHIPEIQVVLDRRQTERRRLDVPVAQDRRAAQRRSIPHLEDDLRARQYVLVRPRHREPGD